MLCICVKEPYIFTQKTYPSAKEPNMYPQKKLYMYPQKSPIFIYQTALYLSAKEPHTRMQTRKDLGPKYDLYLPISISKKSPAYIRQEALYISAKEPHTRTHKKTWSQVVSVCLYIYRQKSPISIHKKALYISAKEPHTCTHTQTWSQLVSEVEMFKNDAICTRVFCMVSASSRSCSVVSRRNCFRGKCASHEVRSRWYILRDTASVAVCCSELQRAALCCRWCIHRDTASFVMCCSALQ